MSKKLVSLLVAICLLLIGATVFAQQKEVVKPVVKPEVVPHAFKSKLDATKANLRALESTLEKMERTKMITRSDVVELDRNMDRYASDLNASFEEALRLAQEFSESKGAKGNIEALKTFEDRVKEDERFFKRLEAKGKLIHDQARDGAIKYERVLIEEMTLEERREHFTPKGREMLEKELPDLFKGLPPTRSERQPTNPISLGSIHRQIGSFFVSEAEAAAALKCLSPCLARNWVECGACLVGAGGAAKACWKSFRSCWDCSGKPWWMARWFYRTFWCIPKLIVCVG